MLSLFSKSCNFTSMEPTTTSTISKDFCHRAKSSWLSQFKLKFQAFSQNQICISISVSQLSFISLTLQVNSVMRCEDKLSAKEWGCDKPYRVSELHIFSLVCWQHIVTKISLTLDLSFIIGQNYKMGGICHANLRLYPVKLSKSFSLGACNGVFLSPFTLHWVYDSFFFCFF